MAFYRCQLQSRLGPQAALERIRGLVRTQPGFRQTLKESFGTRPSNTPPFIGKVEGSAFELHRDIRYRNSFLPRINGQVMPAAGGSMIEISMHLHPFTLVFMLLWLGGVGSGALAILSSHARSGAAFIPAGMFLFGLLMTVGGFYPEALKARRILEQSLRARGA